jgi:hypothetical protein
MGLLDNIGSAPQITPDIMAVASDDGRCRSSVAATSAVAPAGRPSAQQSYPGLKRPPPPVGTVQNGYKYMGGDPRSQDPSSMGARQWR